MDTQLNLFPVSFNSEISRVVLSKCTAEQIAKALNRGPFVEIMRETVLNIHAII